MHRKWARGRSKKKRSVVLRHEQSKHSSQPKKHKFKTIARLFLFGLGLFFLLAIKTHQIAGHSMEPTFQAKDRIFVVKKKPTRYAIITFEPQSAKGESYVKRIIGMPGDLIWVEGTSLYLTSQIEANLKNLYGQKLTAANLPDGTQKLTVTDQVASQLSSYYKIPDDKYFVQGDNRAHSNDSRAFGLVDRSQIEGVVVYRYYPFNKMGSVQ